MSYKIIEDLIVYNYDTIENKNNQFIVIHCNDIFNESPKKGLSVNYTIKEEQVVHMHVRPEEVARHCGITGTYFHPKCRNKNSIGIELLINDNSKYKDLEYTLASLVSDLMSTYNIPIDNVIRHYDVTHKLCPTFYINNSKWKKLKELIISINN